jgi:chromosomal replication initiation ATPase DnaA
MQKLMEHIINAQPGDRIIINVPNWKYQPINIPEKVNDYEAKVNDIINNVLEAVGITMDRLTSDRRHRTLVDCRIYISYACRAYYHLSLSEIGRILNRDHTTILHQIAQFEKFTKNNDAEFMQVYNTIENYIATKNKVPEL